MAGVNNNGFHPPMKIYANRFGQNSFMATKFCDHTNALNMGLVTLTSWVARGILFSVIDSRKEQSLSNKMTSSRMIALENVADASFGTVLSQSDDDKKLKDFEVEALMNSFENLGDSPSLFELPNVLIQHIFSYVKIKNLGKLAQVNKCSEVYVKIRRAQECGYCGGDLTEAEAYLKSLLSQTIDALIREEYLPQEYAVRTDRWPISNLLRKKEKELQLNLGQAISHFIAESQINIVKFLLVHGVNPDIFDRLHDCPPLVWAAELGDKELIKKLIEAGADVNALCFGGVNGALAKAIVFEHEKIVALLLKNGASKTINNIGLSGDSPLHAATKKNKLELVKLLLVHGADSNILDCPHHLPPIVWAAEVGNEEIVKRLIEAGADVNALCFGGVNGSLAKAIHFYNHERIVELLLKNGASKTINNIGRSGDSPLHMAIQKNITEVVELLLNYGADPNILDKRHRLPPLVWAAEVGNEKVVKKLIEARAEVNVLCFGGINGALAKAIVFKHVKIVELLLKNGAAKTINNIGRVGSSPLHMAIEVDIPEIVELLLLHGANSSLLNAQGTTPLQLVKSTHVRKLLQNHKSIDQ